MIDISVFKSLLKKETYDKYKHVIFQIPHMQFEVSNILNSIKDYYDRYPEKDIITVDELKLHFTNTNPAVKNPEAYETLIGRMEDADIHNVQLLIDSINRLSETATANLILQDCIEIVNDYKPNSLHKVEKHLQFYNELTKSVSASEAAVCDMSLDELLRADSAESGIDWHLSFLRETIGPLKPGTLAHIFAYSETGKTSLGIFELVHFAQRMVEPDCVLYLGNEEPVKRSKLRAYSAFAKVDKKSIIYSKDKIIESWDVHIGKKLKMIDDVQQMSQVEQYIHDFKPKIVMIDQGTKVNIPGDHSEVKKLQQLYNKYRQLAIQNNTVIITLGQSDASCANKKWLNLNNMDMSKVGMPGELDVAIGIGRSDEDGFETIRYLSVCKNKLTGIPGRGTVKFFNTKCTYVD